MISFIKRAQLTAFIILLGFSVVSIAKEEPTYSGYLGDEIYGKLQEVEIHEGVKAKRWIDPKLNFANYQKVLIDNVELYPEPEPGPQVSLETLDEIRSYLTEKLNARVGAVLNVTTEPGPGVLRMQTAITGVEIKTEGMKGYEVLPVAAVFGGVKALTGKRDRDVRVYVEARFSDSQSGEVIGAALRKVEGEQLKGKKDQLELEDMQKSLDGATDDAQDLLSGMLAE